MAKHTYSTHRDISRYSRTYIIESIIFSCFPLDPKCFVCKQKFSWQLFNTFWRRILFIIELNFSIYVYFEQLYVEIVCGRFELVSKCLAHLLLGQFLYSVLLLKIIRNFKFSQSEIYIF